MIKAGAHPVFGLLETSEPAELGPGPRKGVRAEAELRSELAKLTGMGPKPELVSSLILLWHDYLNAAHSIAQDAAGPDGAFVHGIMHRREPDYGNAAYWFRRAGHHPAFPSLGSAVIALPASKEIDVLRSKLVPNAKWDPFAFIDAVAEAKRRPELAQPLRHIQKLETEALLNYLLQ